MDDVTSENPTFEPEEPYEPGEDDDLDLPHPPMEPPFDVQQQLNASGDNLQGLQEELRVAEFEAQKKHLVDSFYNEVSHTYGLRLKGRIDYSQFRIDPDGKTLYWTPDDKKISIAAMRGKFRFLGLDTLARRYGGGGAYAVRRSMGLTDYRSGVSGGLGREVAQATRDLAGVREAMTRARDELANNLAKLSATNDRKSEIEKHFARELRKLAETDDTEIQQDIRDRMKKL